MQANNNQAPKGLLFDLDNTLYYYEPANQAGITAVFNYLKPLMTNPSIDLHLIYEQAKMHVKHRLQNTAASHHRLLYIQTMLELLNIFSPLLTKQLYDLYWDSFFAAMHPVEGMLEILTKLAQKYKIGIVTNFIADIQYKKLEQLGISHLISHLVTSEEIGCEKPNPKIFQAACRKMHLQPDELCMIGDDLAADIIPAQSQGMKTIWLVPENKTSNQEHSLFKTCSNFYDIEKRL